MSVEDINEILNQIGHIRDKFEKSEQTLQEAVEEADWRLMVIETKMRKILKECDGKEGEIGNG